MKFSLLVVTTDRLHLVERLLTSLEAQTYKNFEVILIHGPACQEEVRFLAKRFPGVDIQILISKDHCLSRSRNLALPVATGDIIAFPDDDCVYCLDTLANCAEAFAYLPQSDIVLGRTAFIDANIPNASSELKQCSSRYALFRHSISYVQFYKKSVAQTVGSFDENLGLGSDGPYQSGEDTDYLLRAFEGGFSAAHAPSVIVRHPAVIPYVPALKSKVQAYAKGRMQLLRKHKMPAWFTLANIVYPLLRIPIECFNTCSHIFRYRWYMFTARLLALI
jgi:glycosyltransferase involved in cell wall biosynthesis